MSSLRHLNRNTKAIAAIAIFSALYAALRIIPTVPMIGTGATFHLSDILAPLFGILLGPYVGGASIIIGTFAAIGLGTPAPFFGLDFLPAFVVAISLGFLVRGKWLPVVILNALLLVGYAFDPFTSNFIVTPWGTFPYLWMHIVAFIVLLSPLGHKAGQWVKSSKSTTDYSRICHLGLCGYNDAAPNRRSYLRNRFWEYYRFYGQSRLSRNTWNIVFYIYPWERLALIVGAIIVGVPVTRILIKTLFPPKTKPILEAKSDIAKPL